jgi:hypothetical protein
MYSRWIGLQEHSKQQQDSFNIHSGRQRSARDLSCPRLPIVLAVDSCAVYIHSFSERNYATLDFNRSRSAWPLAAVSVGLQDKYIIVMTVKAIKM